MTASAVDERVDLSDVDLDAEPPCGGQYLMDWTGQIRHVPCDAPATWRKTVSHCGRRTRFMCDEHRVDSIYRTTTCSVCRAENIQVEWTRL